MIKALFCDLDGTLFNSEKKLNASAIEAIRELTLKGGLFVVCSGRVPYNVEEVLKPLAFSGSYMIGANGMIIKEGDKYLVKRPYPKELVSRLFDLGVKYDVFIHIQTIDGLYYYHDFKNSHDQLGAVAHIIEKDGLKELEKREIYKICYTPKNPELLDVLISELYKIDSRMEIFKANTFLEMNARGINKAFAIKEFCALHKLNPEDCLAIGDGHNDEAMLRCLGHSACPANGDERLKSFVEYVAKQDNDGAAIKEIIEYYLTM